jgi:hypothetical protein
MCPLCIANIAFIVVAAGAMSRGGLSRTRTLIRRISGRTEREMKDETCMPKIKTVRGIEEMP